MFPPRPDVVLGQLPLALELELAPLAITVNGRHPAPISAPANWNRHGVVIQAMGLDRRIARSVRRFIILLALYPTAPDKKKKKKMRAPGADPPSFKPIMI